MDGCDGRDPRCCGTAGHLGWEQRATTDLGRINRAWDHTPWGIGIACGPAGLIVIDLDTAKDDGPSGAESLGLLEATHGQQLPGTFSVATPSGGRHLYYRRPAGAAIRNSAGKVGSSIDIRSIGGYVVAPPTVITSGSYQIIDDQEPANLPTWFSHLLTLPPYALSTGARRDPRERAGAGRLVSGERARRYVDAAVAGEVERISQAVEGQRNHTLFCASISLGQLVGAGLLDRAEAEDVLSYAATAHVAAGAYSQSQAQSTIASGLRRGIAEPRELPAAVQARSTQ